MRNSIQYSIILALNAEEIYSSTVNTVDEENKTGKF